MRWASACTELPSWCVCLSPNLPKMGARTNSMAKNANHIAVTTWLTSVMLDLLAVYPLSLLWDLHVTFKTLSNFSFTSLFSLCKAVDFDWKYCKWHPASFWITIPLEFRHRTNPSQPMDFCNCFSLFRQGNTQSWGFHYMLRQKVE